MTATTLMQRVRVVEVAEHPFVPVDRALSDRQCRRLIPITSTRRNLT